MSHPLRWLSLVALEEPVLPTFEHLAAWYGERFPDDPQPVLANATDKLLTFTISAASFVRTRVSSSPFDSALSIASLTFDIVSVSSLRRRMLVMR